MTAVDWCLLAGVASSPVSDDDDAGAVEDLLRIGTRARAREAWAAHWPACEQCRAARRNYVGPMIGHACPEGAALLRQGYTRYRKGGRAR